MYKKTYETIASFFVGCSFLDYSSDKSCKLSKASASISHFVLGHSLVKLVILIRSVNLILVSCPAKYIQLFCKCLIAVWLTCKSVSGVYIISSGNAFLIISTNASLGSLWMVSMRTALIFSHCQNIASMPQCCITALIKNSLIDWSLHFIIHGVKNKGKETNENSRKASKA